MRESTRSLVSWEKATLAWGNHAQWNGSTCTEIKKIFIISPDKYDHLYNTSKMFLVDRWKL